MMLHKAIMHFVLTAMLALGVLGLAATAPNNTASSKSSLLPAGYVDSGLSLTFEGPLFVGGPNVTLSGTLEKIVAQINATNPEYFLSNETSNDSVSGHGASKGGNQEGPVYCHLGTPNPASLAPIEEAVSYLERLKGGCIAPAGPGYCGKISCSYDSAVWWCNDRLEPAYYPCKWFAPYTQRIIDRCKQELTQEVEGQSFSGDGTFNVIVGGDRC
ncbi:hypothetical protein SLS62_001784 [Diatrype stigma]|uniref:Uncharacterized protein n=1 Tax=Diatrype stigma TaxID=117547 RepID=A0AAN9UYE1_9PEZI